MPSVIGLKVANDSSQSFSTFAQSNLQKATQQIFALSFAIYSLRRGGNALARGEPVEFVCGAKEAARVQTGCQGRNRAFHIQLQFEYYGRHFTDGNELTEQHARHCTGSQIFRIPDCILTKSAVDNFGT